MASLIWLYLYLSDHGIAWYIYMYIVFFLKGVSYMHKFNLYYLGDNCIQNFHLGRYGRKFSFTATRKRGP